MDPLDLAVQQQPSARQVLAVTGRSAAGVQLAPGSSERLHRALFGARTLTRSSVGGRVVAGILAPDLHARLAEAGYCTLCLTPGSAEATAAESEVLVIDLAGFTGVWAGALAPEGVRLMQEVDASILAARRAGASCWLLVRGGSLHHQGSILLRDSDLVEAIVPGEASREQTHFTENPGDVSGGILDVLRAVEKSA